MIDIEKARKLLVPGCMFITDNYKAEGRSYMIVSCNDMISRRTSDVHKGFQFEVSEKTHTIDVLLLNSTGEIKLHQMFLESWDGGRIYTSAQDLLKANMLYIVCAHSTWGTHRQNIVRFIT